MLCATFGWNCLSGSEEEDFWISSSVFAIFYYFPLEIGGTLHLNKLESPLLKDALCYVRLKLLCSSGEEDKNVQSLRQWQ